MHPINVRRQILTMFIHRRSAAFAFPDLGSGSGYTPDQASRSEAGRSPLPSASPWLPKVVPKGSAPLPPAARQLGASPGLRDQRMSPLRQISS